MSWGNKIILAFSVFVILMLLLVYKSYQTRFDLVSENYYNDELEYEKVIKASKNNKSLKEGFQLVYDEYGLRILIPDGQQIDSGTGNLWFYCPYDVQNDFKCNLVVDNNGKVQYDKGSVKPGRYTLKVDFYSNGKMFFLTRELEI